MRSTKNKELYRQSLGTKLSRSADGRIWSNIQGELAKQSSRGHWLQISFAAGVVCTLLVIIILRNSPIRTGEEIVATEIDQVSEVAFEIDQELSSTQILAYDDFENLGIEYEY